MTGSNLRRFTRSARRKPQLWRLALGILLAAAIAVLTGILIVGASFRLFPAEFSPSDWASTAGLASTPAGAFLVLSTILGLGLGAMLAAVLAHGRSIGSLFGPGPQVLRDFALAAAVAIAVNALLTGGWAVFYDSRPGLDLFLWVSVLPLTVLMILLQTGAEELLFRGYLLQQIAARFAHPAVAMIVTAIAFGLLHISGQPSQSYGIAAALNAGLFGLLAAELTIRTGSIGAAWGFHFANNLFPLAILATPDTISGLALRLSPYPATATTVLEMIVNAITVTVIWWLIRRLVTR